MKNKKIRYAVMGLGHIAQVAILPAFKHAKENSELVALVSDSPSKLNQIGKKYRISKSNQFSYEEFPQCLVDAKIDVLYLATPNDTHCQYAIDALSMGVHVLCEKPLAISQKQCEAMIKASELNNRLLMTAYRLHFEVANLTALKMIKDEKLGKIRTFNSSFTMQVKDLDNIRLNSPKDGGGPLWDIGIYCINGVRSLFQDEPTEVFAYAVNNGEKRFKKTQEMINVVMKFPQDRLGSFVCSFGADSCSSYDLIGTKGRVHLEHAYDYALPRELTLIKEDKNPKVLKFPKSDQFAPELVYFSNCILNKKVPETSGKEGLADVLIIEAILKSIKKGKSIQIKPQIQVSHPKINQLQQKPGLKKTRVIQADAPGGNKS